MRSRISFLVAALSLASCDKEGEVELSDYVCRVCGEYDPIIEVRNGEAEAASCRHRKGQRNGGVTCSVDNVQYEQLVITYSDCEKRPPCDFEGLTAQGGSSAGWDYECHICGDEGEVDSAHDGGAEDSGCRDTGILRGLGDECPSGEAATLVGFSDCESAPACIAE